MNKQYVIYGNPIPWKRAVPSYKHAYDSQKNEKLVIGLNLRKQHGNTGLLQGPLFLNVTFFMPIPKSLSKKKQELLKGSWHFIKPDFDNLEKFLLDCCKNVIFNDDCAVCDIIAKKMYDDNKGPRTQFQLIEIENNGKNE